MISWAQRKRNAVLRWGKSTASLNLKGWGKTGIPAHYGADNADVSLPVLRSRPSTRRRALSALALTAFLLNARSTPATVAGSPSASRASSLSSASPSSRESPLDLLLLALIPSRRTPSLTLRFPPTPFSGLKQEEDHQVIVDVLRELIAEQEK